MITTGSAGSAGFSIRLGWLSAACLVALGGCASDRETTLARAGRQRELGAMRAERQRLQQESELLARTNGELAAAIAQARRESTAASAELRTALVLLQHDVDRLRMAEQDLTVARRRGAEIEQALTPLRALEVALREQEQLRAEATRKIAALQAEAATKEAEVAAVTAELQPRVQALAARLAALKQLGVTLANAEAAIEQALKGVTPAPAETKK